MTHEHQLIYLICSRLSILMDNFKVLLTGWVEILKWYSWECLVFGLHTPFTVAFEAKFPFNSPGRWQAWQSPSITRDVKAVGISVKRFFLCGWINIGLFTICHWVFFGLEKGLIKRLISFLPLASLTGRFVNLFLIGIGIDFFLWYNFQSSGVRNVFLLRPKTLNLTLQHLCCSAKIWDKTLSILAVLARGRKHTSLHTTIWCWYVAFQWICTV